MSHTTTPTAEATYVSVAMTRAKTLRDEAKSSASRDKEDLKTKRDYTVRFNREAQEVHDFITESISELRALSKATRQAEMDAWHDAHPGYTDHAFATTESICFKKHRNAMDKGETTLLTFRTRCYSDIWKQLIRGAGVRLPHTPPVYQHLTPKDVVKRREPRNKSRKLPDFEMPEGIARTALTIFLVIVPTAGVYAATHVIEDVHARSIFVPVLLYAYVKRWGHVIFRTAPMYRDKRTLNIMNYCLTAFLVLGTIAVSLGIMDPLLVSLTAFAVASILAEKLPGS